MATVTNGWISFAGNKACRASDISHVYEVDNMVRICLKNGSAFYVSGERYADIVRAIAEASA